MSCKRCTNEPVFKLISGVSLCKSCFLKYFEKKVRKTIRQYKLIKKGDYLGVAISGGKDSLTTLHILNNLSKKGKYFTLVAIAVNEGIDGYRNKTLEDAKAFCEERNIPLHINSYQEEFSMPLDQMIKKTNMKACSICGVFRRYLLNKKARELGVNKLATGHNLDDEAQSVVMNLFRSNQETSARLGPITGVRREEKLIPRIKPLYFMTEREVTAYTFLKGFKVSYNECPNANDSFRGEIRDMLNSFEAKHPGLKNAIIQGFMETLPLLKEHYKGSKDIGHCELCQEPSAELICRSCQLAEELKKKEKS